MRSRRALASSMLPFGQHRQRAGVSEALASVTLILIVTTLGAVLLSYGSFSFQSSQATARTQFSGRSDAVRERLTVEFVQFTAPSTITVYLRNTGGIDLTIPAVYISDPNGQILSSSSTDLNLSTGQLGSVTLSFTFTSGNTYLITLPTSRGSSLTTSWKA